MSAANDLLEQRGYEKYRKKRQSGFGPSSYGFKNLTTGKVLRSLVPILKTVGKIGVPLAAAASNYAEAKEGGLPAPLALAYAGSEELNPLPISGMDYYKGMEKSAEGIKKNKESIYMPEEMKAELKAKESYINSPAAKDRAYSRLRDLLKTEDNKELVDQLFKKKLK